MPAPDPASWPLLALTIVLHTGYHLFLPAAYEHGDLGQVYPIARGFAPRFVTVGAVVLAGSRCIRWRSSAWSARRPG